MTATHQEVVYCHCTAVVGRALSPHQEVVHHHRIEPHLGIIHHHHTSQGSRIPSPHHMSPHQETLRHHCTTSPIIFPPHSTGTPILYATLHQNNYAAPRRLPHKILSVIQYECLQ